MFNLLRLLLFPLAIIYGTVVSIRNFLFDIGILKSYTPSVKTIVIGNLSTGGTGKTPFTELLIRHFASTKKIAVVSRGYGRSSKGFYWVEANSTPDIVGDEPLQIKQNFNDILVAVCESRKEAIERIAREHKEVDLIILDDAFQHRYVKGHVNILLTTFRNPFFRDFILPVGNLREMRSSVKRANLLVVTKCPADLSDAQKALFKSEIPLFFSENGYGEIKGLKGEVFSRNNFDNTLAISGLADSTAFEEELESSFKNVVSLRFKDHKTYDALAVQKIKTSFEDLAKQGSACIVTTEKDAVKLKTKINELNGLPIFVLPFSHHLRDQKSFFTALDKLIG